MLRDSFFDSESIKKHEKYLGRRIKRSWFRTATGFRVHADYHGALNIGKKQFPQAFMPKEIVPKYRDCSFAIKGNSL